jgi:2-isopropylmalate synthase
MSQEHDLIHDWNEAGERWEKPAFQIQFDDETLRDGLQSPSVRTPTIEQKLEILHLMDRLGHRHGRHRTPGAARTSCKTSPGSRRRSSRAS